MARSLVILFAVLACLLQTTLADPLLVSVGTVQVNKDVQNVGIT